MRLSPETWEMMNHALGLGAVTDEVISIEHLRTDTTVTECNIHWPTDSSLLWDTYRVIAREISLGRQIDPLSCPWRFHVKKIKKMDFFISRYSNSTSKKRFRQVRQRMKQLIVRVEEVLEKAGEVRCLGRAFDLPGTDGRWRGAGGLFAGDASGDRGRAASRVRRRKGAPW